MDKDIAPVNTVRKIREKLDRLFMRSSWKSYIVFTISFALGAFLYLKYAQPYIDDAFIYFEAARNFSQGYGPVINPGDTHSVVTSPMWLVFLSMAWIISGGIEASFFIIIVLINILLLLIGSILLYLVLKDVPYHIAGLAPLAMFSIPYLPYFFGLETPLVLVMITLITLWILQKRSWVETAILIGLAYLVRGELILFIGPLILMEIVEVWSVEGSSIRQMVRNAIIQIGIVFSIPVLFHLIQYFAFQIGLPQSLEAKVLQGSSGFWPLYASNSLFYLREAAGARIFYITVSTLGLILVARSIWPILVFSLLHVLGYWFLGVADYSWYAYDIFLIGRISFVAGIGIIAYHIFALLRQLFDRAYSGKFIAFSGAGTQFEQSGFQISAIICIFIFSLSIPGLPLSKYKSLWSGPRQKASVMAHSAVAQWIKTDASNTNGECLILAQEVGALAFYSGECEVRDINGLASEGLERGSLNAWMDWVEIYKPTYLVPMFDRWPERKIFLDQNGDMLIYEKQFIADEDNPIRKGIVYSKIRENAPPTIEYAMEMHFTNGSPYNIYLASNWLTRDEGSWASLNDARIVFPIIPCDSQGTLDLILFPFIHEASPEQRVILSQGGLKIFEVVLEEPKPTKLSVRVDLSKNPVVIDLGLPDSVVPANIGASTTRESLSVMLMSATMYCNTPEQG